MLSHIQFFVIPWTVYHQALLSMEFSRQEYWSGLLFPTLGYLPYPEVKPTSFSSSAFPSVFFTTAPPGKT